MPKRLSSIQIAALNEAGKRLHPLQGASVGNLGDILDGADQVLDDAVDLLNAAPAAISASDIDWSVANVFTKTTTGNTTFTFSNAVDGKTIMVSVTAGGAHTVTWPTVLWAAGSAPAQTSSGRDIYSFTKIGSSIIGTAVQDVR